MAGLFAYTCTCCGERHEGSPSFSSMAPFHYDCVPAALRDRIATLTSDTCVLSHDDGKVDRFIRVVLELPIHGAAEPFTWGVWVSLSEASFARYTAAFGDNDTGDVYFGWFATRLPCYPDTINLKTHVHPRPGGQRPWLELDTTDHPLAVHQREGLTADEAQAIAEAVMHGASD